VTGREPRWDGDRLWGEQGEQYIRGLNGRPWEAKRKRRLDGWIYVETEQDPGRRGQWKPSGIITSEADNWVYLIGETGIATFLPIDLLRWAIQQGYGKDCAETDGDNPTRGKLLRIEHLIHLSKEWVAEGGHA
jgi:hypothetical protein